MLAYGRLVKQWPVSEEYLYVAEGIDADVVVTQMPDQNRLIHVSGKCVASSVPVDMRIERMLGHLPAMAHPHPKTVLVIGCGAGVTAGSLLKHPSVERIVICDIEACVPKAARSNFAYENYGVVDDPRTLVIVDDARHFLASTKEKFDVITTDPIHPWVRGAAALYTYEFFEMCKDHLNPGGIVAQWVPLYETSEAAVKCELATLLKSFPHATLWDSELSGNGYDMTVLATGDGSPIDVAQMERAWNSNPQVRESLANVDIDSMDMLLKTCFAAGPELDSWLRDAEINHDRNLRLQYLAGLALDNQRQKDIFRIMARLHRLANPPEDDSEPASPLAN
jgi:spermidine synthase